MASVEDEDTAINTTNPEYIWRPMAEDILKHILITEKDVFCFESHRFLFLWLQLISINLSKGLVPNWLTAITLIGVDDNPWLINTSLEDNSYSRPPKKINVILTEVLTTTLQLLSFIVIWFAMILVTKWHHSKWPTRNVGPFSMHDKTPYRNNSWSLEASKLVV